MIDIARLYLDSNIFIRAFEGSDPEAAALRRLLFFPARDPVFLVTSQLTYAEVVQKPYADGNEKLIGVYEGWLRAGTPTLEIGRIDADCLYFAAVLRATIKSLRLPDAIHLSTAVGAGCSHVLTDDRRIPDSIELWHTRDGMTRGPAVLKVLRPNLDLLSAIAKANP